MRRLLAGLVSLGVAALGTSAAHAQGTVKIGVIMSYSGQFADTATQIDNGIKLYMKQKGDTVAGKKIEIIRKIRVALRPMSLHDLRRNSSPVTTSTSSPGLHFPRTQLRFPRSPAEAKKFMVIMNAATTVIITMSPYWCAPWGSLPSVGITAGEWAYKSGIRQVYTMVSDFAPGKDAEAASHEAFKKAGGEIVGSVRMPVANPDFSAFVQRAKDVNPESIFLFCARWRSAACPRQSLRGTWS